MEFGFEKLDVWQRAVQYYTDVCKLDSKFQKNDLFGQAAQLKSSALSISLNIAEGSGRQYKKEFKQFLGIARGSVFETVTNLCAAYKRGIITKDEYEKFYAEGASIARMISGLMKKT